MFIQTLLNPTGLSPFGGSMLCPVNISLCVQTENMEYSAQVSVQSADGASISTTKAVHLEDGCSPEPACCYSHHLH